MASNHFIFAAVMAGFDARSWLALSFLYGQLSLPASNIVLRGEKKSLELALISLSCCFVFFKEMGEAIS